MLRNTRPIRRALCGVGAVLVALTLGCGLSDGTAGSTPKPVPSPTVCMGEVLGELATVNCQDPAAKYAVLGTVEQISKSGFDTDWKPVCASWPSATVAFWREYSWAEIGTTGSGVGAVTCAIEIPPTKPSGSARTSNG